MELITLPKTNHWIPKMIVCQKVALFKSSFYFVVLLMEEVLSSPQIYKILQIME